MLSRLSRLGGRLLGRRVEQADDLALPLHSWRDVVPVDVPIQPRDRDSGVDGNVTGFELELISRLVSFHDPKTIFEIGTFDGRTTLNMAAHARAEARIFTLDLPQAKIESTGLPIEQADRQFIDKPRSGSRFIGTDVERKITQLYGDSATFDFSPYFGMIDFIFIDGSHAYEYALKDSDTAFKLAAEGGVILWHDYVGRGFTAWPGVTRALHELRAGDGRFRNMVNIAGTAVAYLQVSGARSRAIIRRAPAKGLDSSQPENLLATLDVELKASGTRQSATMQMRVRAKNIGHAMWLGSEAACGPVNLGVHLLDPAGNVIAWDYARAQLPAGGVRTGEKISFDAAIPTPPSGRFVVEFDLVAEGVTWFARNGSQTVRLPITIA